MIIPIPTADIEPVLQLSQEEKMKVVDLAYEAVRHSSLLSIRINEENEIIGAGLLPTHEYRHYKGPFIFHDPKNIINSLQF